jgi:hypothetical protein
MFWLFEGNNGINSIKLVSYFSTTLWHAAPKQHYQYRFICKTYIFMYLLHSFTVFYFHDYIAQMLYVLTDKQIYGEVLREKLNDLQSFCWSAILRLLCNSQFTHVETACHRSSSSAKQIGSVTVIYVISPLTLSSNLRLGIQSRLYPSSLLTAVFFALAFSLACSSQVSWFHLVRNSSWTPLTNAQLLL